MEEELYTIEDFAKDYFKEFLCKNNAYKAFCDNIKVNGEKFSEYIKRQNNPQEFLSRAFLWGVTSQGLAYWLEINKLWEETLEDIEDDYSDYMSYTNL